MLRKKFYIYFKSDKSEILFFKKNISAGKKVFKKILILKKEKSVLHKQTIDQNLNESMLHKTSRPISF